MSDAVFLGLLGAIVVGIGLSVAVGRRLAAHYREEGALVLDTFTPGRPCRLALPASGALDLMVRFATTRSRGTSESITAVVELDRGDAATRTRFAVGLTATGPRPDGLPFTGSDGISYAVSKRGRMSTRTKVLARLAGGGPGWVTVDLLGPAADFGYCAAFVKPAKA